MFKVYRYLTELYKKWSAQEFGRICQALLGLTFKELGYVTRMRWTERPDIEVTKNDKSYAVEVKATAEKSIQIEQRSLDGVLQQKNSIPIFAILSMELNPKWIIVDAYKLKPCLLYTSPSPRD